MQNIFSKCLLLFLFFVSKISTYEYKVNLIQFSNSGLVSENKINDRNSGDNPSKIAIATYAIIYTAMALSEAIITITNVTNMIIKYRKPFMPIDKRAMI